MLMRREYYEAILQVRGSSASEQLREVLKFVEAEAQRSKYSVQIAKRKRVRGGFDYYLSSKKFAVALGKALQESFGGQRKLSEKLFGISRHTGKTVYRLAVLFRLSSFAKGKIVEADATLMKITSIGKLVHGIDLSSNRKLLFTQGKFAKMKPKAVETFSTVVAKTYPALEVIHPQTFQSVQATNTLGKQLKHGEKVVVVMYKDKAFIV